MGTQMKFVNTFLGAISVTKKHFKLTKLRMIYMKVKGLVIKLNAHNRTSIKSSEILNY